MKLYVLYGGDIICRDVAQLNSGMEHGGEMALANPIFLIEHPQGRVLWDSGLPDGLIDTSEGVEAWIFHLKMQQTVLGQLAELSLQASDIDYFALSHVHNDHTGNAHYFKASTLVMQEKEYEVAFHSEKRPYNYGDYELLKDSKVLMLRGDHDLFGDGLVQFISTPGHTPGHQSLCVKLEQTGTVIISGDISYYEENFRNKGVPTYNTDYAQSLASIAKIEHWVQSHEAQLWIQHDKDRFEKLRLSPEYYQ